MYIHVHFTLAKATLRGNAYGGKVKSKKQQQRLYVARIPLRYIRATLLANILYSKAVNLILQIEMLFCYRILRLIIGHIYVGSVDRLY